LWKKVKSKRKKKTRSIIDERTIVIDEIENLGEKNQINGFGEK